MRYETLLRRLIGPAFVVFSLLACGIVPTPTVTPVPTATPTPTPTPTATSTPTVTPTPTSTPTPTVTPTPTIPPGVKARAGEWRGTIESESVDGAFMFVVSPSGKEITGLELRCRIAGYGTVSFEFGEDAAERASEGGGVPISDDGSFRIRATLVLFRGRFSEDGTSASGLFEMALAPADTTVSAAWEIRR
jgi:hypothetical protein